ncbi:MAG: hypothetical protein H8E73_09760 [Planctomycetes bacterium]|jgi:hypothetical protein|nr:hypothetical protein [Planctomycetota bacterium]MBL7184989.1 hypothetical protein [Phycisphaerae bacterium]
MMETKRVVCEPAGRGTNPEDRRIRRIRSRSSYLLFRQLHDFLKSKPDIADILRRFHDILDAKRGFGSRRNAEYASESLAWVLRDVGKDGQRA